MYRPLISVACMAGALLLPSTLAAETIVGMEPVALAQTGAIEAPGTVDPGDSVVVTFRGATGDGWFELWGPITHTGRGGRLAIEPATGGRATLRAPMDPGSYELRFLTPGGVLRARTPFDVAAVPVTLSVPEQMGKGLETEIRWHGPARPGDLLQIVDPATGAVVSEVPAVGTPGARNITPIRSPEAPGDYLLRYVSGSRSVVLRSLPVTVVEGKAWLRSPVEVFAGEEFNVQWNGPLGDDHAFQVIDPVNDVVVSSQPGAESATLVAPGRPGDYRIRYVDVATGFVHADLPLQVDRN